MEASYEHKTKTLLLGVPKNLLVASALIKIIFESSSLKSQKHVHGQAANSRPTAWLIPADNAIGFTSFRQ